MTSVTASHLATAKNCGMQFAKEVRSYRDLIVWQKEFDLVAHIYECTQRFPREELYGLVSQLRRAAVSVPSNIAEGHSRVSTGEFRQFLGHAQGSLVEIETQLLIANRLRYINADETAKLLRHRDEIGRMLTGLLRSLPERRSARTHHTIPTRAGS